MIMAELPMFMAHESETILGFFENAFFAPLQMRQPQFVPWSNDDAELVFPCHTSIMSQDLLIDKMKKYGYCPSDY